MPWLFEWPGMLGPIELLGVNADGVGVVNTVPEIDGVVRRMPLILRVGDETYPAMAIETIRVAVGDPSYQVKTQQGGITAMRIPKYATIKTDANGRIWLRWNKEVDTYSLTEKDYPHLRAEGRGQIRVDRYHLPVSVATSVLTWSKYIPRHRPHNHTLLNHHTSPRSVCHHNGDVRPPAHIDAGR